MSPVNKIYYRHYPRQIERMNKSVLDSPKSPKVALRSGRIAPSYSALSPICGPFAINGHTRFASQPLISAFLQAHYIENSINAGGVPQTGVPPPESSLVAPGLVAIDSPKSYGSPCSLTSSTESLNGETVLLEPESPSSGEDYKGRSEDWVIVP